MRVWTKLVAVGMEKKPVELRRYQKYKWCLQLELTFSFIL